MNNRPVLEFENGAVALATNQVSGNGAIGIGAS